MACYIASDLSLSQYKVEQHIAKAYTYSIEAFIVSIEEKDQSGIAFAKVNKSAIAFNILFITKGKCLGSKRLNHLRRYQKVSVTAEMELVKLTIDAQFKIKKHNLFQS